MLHCVIAFLLFSVLLVDLYARMKRSSGGVLHVDQDFKGIIPAIDIAILAGLSSYYSGWPGWVLLVVAALYSGTCLKFVNNNSEDSPYEVMITVRLFVLFQIVTVAGLFKYFFVHALLN
jgi:hypothetical protein